jgi:cell division protein FtsQ
MGSGRRDLSRLERAALARRNRARAHLQRVQRRTGSGARLRPARPARLALLAVSVGAGVLFGGPLLRAVASVVWGRVDAIYVGGAVQLAPEAVAAATGVARGASLASVDPQEVAARVAELPWIAAARAVRMPAGPLVVGIRERVPVARVEAGERAALLDATGMPFAEAGAEDGSELPRIRLAEGPIPEAADPRLSAALELAYRLPEHGLAVPSEVQLAAPDDPEGFSLRLTGLAGRVVLGRDAPEARLPDLAALLAAGLPEVAAAPIIDLRFADRAVLGGGSSQGGAAQAAPARGSATASRTGSSG